ncbi:MAG: porin [Alistipes sp.]|nr:porin [Alistipes sp.]
MKKLLLLLAAVSATLSVSAQRHISRHRHADKPTVYIISVKESDTIWSNNPALAAQHSAMMRNEAAQAATADHLSAQRSGFQQTATPSVIFANARNSFSFAIGGYVNLRTAYSWNNVVDDIDMVPYQIPIPSAFDTKQQIRMDATTSRLFLRGIANTRHLGKVEIYFDADFRGGTQGSYTPRLRSGYVSFKGLTIGRDVTTFCDLDAAPTTIDFQGPNAYNFRFATQIRYEISFLKRIMKAGVSLEMPNPSGTYGEHFAPVPQRVPDIPLYLQASWGKHRQSHIRASAVLRNSFLYNVTGDYTEHLFGWGVQASGKICITRMLDIYFNGVYGKGITPYIQDLTGSGLDFAPNPADPTRIQQTPMYGWQAAAQLNILPNLSVSGGYSAVTVEKKNGYYSPEEYRRGQYVFGNVFYHLTRRFTLAAEYLWATRKNMDGNSSDANRVNIMMQYNF